MPLQADIYQSCCLEWYYNPNLPPNEIHPFILASSNNIFEKVKCLPTRSRIANMNMLLTYQTNLTQGLKNGILSPFSIISTLVKNEKRIAYCVSRSFHHHTDTKELLMPPHSTTQKLNRPPNPPWYSQVEEFVMSGMFLLEELLDVPGVVPVQRLDRLCRVTHGDYPFGDVCTGS